MTITFFFVFGCRLCCYASRQGCTTSHDPKRSAMNLRHDNRSESADRRQHGYPDSAHCPSVTRSVHHMVSQ